jgi:hypothetical protein
LWLESVAEKQHLWFVNWKRPVCVIELVIKLMLALSFITSGSALLSCTRPTTSATTSLVAVLSAAVVGAV